MHGNDWFSSTAERCTTQKVDLPANAGIKYGSDGVGTNLPGNVNLQSRVNSRNLWVLSNYAHPVGIFHILHGYSRIVVHKIVKFFGTHQKSSHHFTVIQFFVFPVNDTFFHQWQNSV